MRRRTLLAATAALSAAPRLARAQDAWPSRPVLMVAPLAAGSSVDIVARTIAVGWAPRIGQPVIVENRPAANGTVAFGQVARSAPDGYTITITGQTSIAFNPQSATLRLPLNGVESRAAADRAVRTAFKALPQSSRDDAVGALERALGASLAATHTPPPIYQPVQWPEAIEMAQSGVMAIGSRASINAHWGVTPQAQKTGVSPVRISTGSPKSGRVRSPMPMAAGSPQWTGAPWTLG